MYAKSRPSSSLVTPRSRAALEVIASLPTDAMSVAEIRMSGRVRPTSSSDPCAVTTDLRAGVIRVVPTGDAFPYPSFVIVGSDRNGADQTSRAPLVPRALTWYDCALLACG
jgi:hypothetical protein